MLKMKTMSFSLAYELSEVYGLDFEQKRGKERLYVITNKNLKEELDEE